MPKETPICAASFTLAYASSEITRLHDALVQFAESFSPPEKALRQFILAVEEIVVNAIKHGKNSVSGAGIMVELRHENDTLSGEIIDTASPFDPFMQGPEPDLTSAVSDRPIGGLGIHIAKKMVDQYQYFRRAGCNHTLLVKKLR